MAGGFSEYRYPHWLWIAVKSAGGWDRLGLANIGRGPARHRRTLRLHHRARNHILSAVNVPCPNCPYSVVPFIWDAPSSMP
jgi:hypothetical protein